MTPKNPLNTPPPEEDYSLEDILAEYGGSLEHRLLREASPPAAKAPEAAKEAKAPEAPAAKAPEAQSPPPEPPAPAAESPRPKAPPASPPPRPKAPPASPPPRPKAVPPAAPEAPDPSPEDLLIPGRGPRRPGKRNAPPGPEAAAVSKPDVVSKPPVTEEVAAVPEPPVTPEAAAPEEAAVVPKSPVTEEVPAVPEPPVTPEAAAPEEAAVVPKSPVTEEVPAVPEPPVTPEPDAAETPPEPAPVPDPLEEAGKDASGRAIPHPRPMSLEDVVGSTVDAVMEEAREPILPPRRGLFSRKPLEETETIPPPPEPEPEPEPEPIGPEPSLWEAAHAARQLYIRRKHTVILPLVTALPPTLLLLLERYQVKVPYWSGDPRAQSAFLLVCLGLTAVLCRHVFVKGFGMLPRRRCVAELLVSLAVLVSGADCALRLLGRGGGGAPYASVGCLSLVFAQWGVRRESKGNYDMLRAAAVDDDPPYLVASTPQGACKQRGSVPGFFTTAARSDAATLWQTALLPAFLAAALVFAGLSSAGQERGGDFLLNLSAILPAAATFSLPLCWALPWSKLSEHLQRTGCAVAGWSGAQKISARRRMIVTDSDLFPPGAVQLNGRKLFAETQEQAVSLAASMARAAGSGLERLFNNLVRSEGGRYEKVDDFSFYEEGGWSGTIKGESVLMGGISFMRKMNIRLPADVNLKTGVFLAVDKELIAVFAVKYSPSENVDFAMKLMQRSRIQPILASRDPNITPSLIKRKFSRNVHMEYPGLTERVALSEAEKDRDLPRALLFREGLLPYAEAVAGSLRLCKAVRRAAAISLLGGWAGTLLTFYLTSLGAYELLNPLALEVFLLLWTLPVLLMSDWTGRY